MSRVIIGIHGLGNKPPAPLLEEWWRLSISEGFANASLRMPPVDFKLVYWADLLYKELIDPAQTNPKHPLFLDEPYVPSDPAYHPEKTGDFRKRLINLIGDQLENIFLKDNLTINFSSVSDFIVQRFFKDLAAYYQTYHDDIETADTQLQSKIRNRLAEVLRQNRKRKIILIAHSMGSIIAYDTLTRVVPEVEIDTLITIGSPLGIPTIRAKIAAESGADHVIEGKLKTPENVTRKWYNLADLRDKIALYYHLSDDFVANANHVKVTDLTILNDFIFNGEKNPHKAYGYLRSAEMATRIQEFFEETTPGWVKTLQRWLALIGIQYPRTA